MRVLVHDYSGHPFQAELSRELAARGHDVVHSSCPGYISGKGRLEADGQERITFETVGKPVAEKEGFVRRTLRETALGPVYIRHLRAVRPDVVLLSNTPVPTMVVAALYMAVARIPWVYWQQDVYSVAARNLAGDKAPAWWRLAAKVLGLGEKLASKLARDVVVIAESFVDVHEEWGTAEKVTVIPNWAPLDEIVPTPRDNAWAREHGLDEGVNLVYSGTLGLKHNPLLLIELTKRVRELGEEARLVVVNTGPATELLRTEAARHDVPLTLLPFQPYDRLPEVLGSADMLVVLLEKSAGAFSVPSKALSYLCAGRPVVGLMPEENLASQLLRSADCEVFEPDSSAIDRAAKWVVDVVGDESRTRALSLSTRGLAEAEFSRERCADSFESLLSRR